VRRLWLWLAELIVVGALLVLLPAPAAQSAGHLSPWAQGDETPTVTATATFTETPSETPTVTPTDTPTPTATPASIQTCTDVAAFVTVEKRVGLSSDVCTTGVTQLSITAGTPIYYCYRLAVASSLPAPATVMAMTLLDEDPQLVVPWQPGAVLVPAGGSLQVSRPVPSDIQAAITASRATTATWNLLVNGLGCAIASNTTTVSVGRPRTEVILRVAGSSGDPCAVANAVNNIGSSQFANFCLGIRNSGNLTLTQHTVDVPQLGINNVTIAAEVGPGGIAYITSSSTPAIAQLTRQVREVEFSAEARVVSVAIDGVAAPAAYNAATSRSAAAISVRKVVTRNPTGCPDVSDSPIIAGQLVYLCYSVTNNGPVELLQHSFTDSGVNVATSFVTEIPVNGTLNVNNATLSQLGRPQILGPFAASSGVNGNVTFVAQNQALGFRAQGAASASSTVNTPTPGPTDEPTPTNTPVFAPTATPLPTLTPFPPTPTATPTWTPAPTWTPPPTVIIFTTPNSQGTPYPSIGGGQPPATQQFPADPFAQTAIASAATATAIFFQTQGGQGGYPPPGDPFAATATAIFLQSQGGDPFGATATAVFLQSQTNPGGYPAPGDPFGATATANALQAQTGLGADPFVATATALALLAQGGMGGYPAPDDPFGATATANAFLTQPSGSDPFVATATALALLAQGGLGGDPLALTATALAGSSPSGYPAPDDPLAAQTAPVSPSLTPAVVAVAPPPVIVTATPDPNITVTPTQRPVAAPAAAPNGSLLALLASVLDAAVTALTLLGLVGGAGLFFVVAIVLIVLTVRARRADPYGLTADADATFTADAATPLPEAAAPLPEAAAPLPEAAAPLPEAAAPLPEAAAPPAAEDHWPTSLP
jgi:hypothetical protein